MKIHFPTLFVLAGLFCSALLCSCSTEQRKVVYIIMEDNRPLYKVDGPPLKRVGSPASLIAELHASNISKVDLVADASCERHLVDGLKSDLVKSSIVVGSVTAGTGTYEGPVTTIQGPLKLANP